MTKRKFMLDEDKRIEIESNHSKEDRWERWLTIFKKSICSPADKSVVNITTAQLATWSPLSLLFWGIWIFYAVYMIWLSATRDTQDKALTHFTRTSPNKNDKWPSLPSQKQWAEFYSQFSIIGLITLIKGKKWGKLKCKPVKNCTCVIQFREAKCSFLTCSPTSYGPSVTFLYSHSRKHTHYYMQ